VIRFWVVFAVLILYVPSWAAESVRDFGAVGDGKANDTAAFVAALKASPRISVPAGSYLIDGLKIETPGVAIVGAGEGQTILLDSGGPTLNFDGSRCFMSFVCGAKYPSDCSLRGLTIRGRGWDRERDDMGLLVHAAPRLTVDGVTVENFAGRGAMIHNKETVACRFSNLTVRNVTAATVAKVTRHGWGITIYGGGNWGAPSDCVLRDIRVEKTSQAGLVFDAGTNGTTGFPPTGISVFGLTLVDCGTSPDGSAAALTFSGGQYCLVDGLRINYTSRPIGRAIVFARDNCSQRHNSSWNTVTNAIITGCGTDPIAKVEGDGTNVVLNVVTKGWAGGIQRADRTVY
jgi:hypothetical protein